jgi:hypothetical protein
LDPAERRALNNRVTTLSVEGFRGPSPAEKGPRKVAFILGGSAAFGHFATRDETTISGYLNALQDQYLFVNAGVPSWVSSQELERLALELVAYQPALVIAYDGFNDAATGADYAARGITMPPGAPESFDELSNLVDDIRGTRRATRVRLHRRLFPHLMNQVDTWREGGATTSQPTARSTHVRGGGRCHADGSGGLYTEHHDDVTADERVGRPVHRCFPAGLIAPRASPRGYVLRS